MVAKFLQQTILSPSRSGDMNWGLLPFSGMLTVKTGFHAAGKNGGFLPGFPEFTAWMGKNSSNSMFGNSIV